jgi:MFS family permease
MSYTIGSVIGPTIGGFLGASGDYYFGAKLAVAGSLLSVVITLFMPDHVPEKVKSEDDEVSQKDSENKLASTSSTAIPSIMTVVSIVWLFLSTKIITSVANAMGAAAFPLILKNIYSLNESSLGLTMSLMSAFNAVVNGFLLGPILSLAGGNTNMLIAMCVFGMFILSLIQSIVALPTLAAHSAAAGLYEYIGMSFLLSMIQYVLSTTITSESTTRVGQNAKGEGVCYCVFLELTYLVCNLLCSCILTHHVCIYF